jgi:hypothetical protein
VLEKDEADRRRERRMRIVGAAAMVSLVPILIWAAAYGVEPLIRGAYSLMAAGCVAGVVAEWLFLSWSRRALPQPHDTRSQLQRTILMLDFQAWLARTGALWSSPVFIGFLLIGVWLYRERTAVGAVGLSVLAIAIWLGTGLLSVRAAAELARRRRELEGMLAGL